MTSPSSSNDATGESRAAFLTKSLMAAGAVMTSAGLLSQADLAAAADLAIRPRSSIRIEYPQTGGANNPFFTVLFNGAKQAGKDLGIKANVRGTVKFDGSVEQARLVQAAIATKPNGIVTGVWDPSAMKDPIEKAVKAGIPVVMINTGLKQWQEYGALAFVGQDEYKAGLAAGKAMRTAGVTKAFILNHDLGQQNLLDRQNGFKAGLKGQTKVVVTDINDVTASLNRVKASLQSSDYNGIFGLSAPYGGEPALAAVKALGKGKQYKIGTFDYSPIILQQLVSNPQMLLAVDQQQYLQGYLPMVWLTLYTQYGLRPYEPVLTGPNLITAKDAKAVIELSAKGYR